VVVAVHVASLVVAFLALMYLGRHLWFFFDEWDVVGNPGPSLFAPHNEHWSTIPYLVYGTLYAVFGLRTYAPYLAVTLLLHVGVAHLLWRVLLTGGVRPWVATALVGVFLFLGAGQENLVWAFQMGFVGSVFFGMVEVLLVDHAARFGSRDVAAWAASVAALMCSDIGVLMVLMAGTVALLRRGPRALIATAAPPAAVFLAWYAAFGHRGQAAHATPGLVRLVAFVYSGLSSTLGQASGLDRFHMGGVILATLVAWALWSARRLRREAPVALAGLVAAIAFFAFVSAGRAELGVDYSQASRYLYIAAAMLVPAAGAALSAAASTDKRVELAVLALLLVCAAVGAGSLRGHYHAQADLDAAGERHILAAADLLGDPVLGLPSRLIGSVPDPHVAPQLSLARVARFRRDGALPSEVGMAAPTALDREQTQVQLSLALTPVPLVPAGATAAHASVSQADATGLGAGCWVLTPRGTAPELRIHADGPFALEMFAGQPASLGLGGRPAGAPIQVVVAPVVVPAGPHVFLDSVLPPPADVTLGLPLGGSLTVCGLAAVPAA
jgi:hypothetical protein